MTSSELAKVMLFPQNREGFYAFRSGPPHKKIPCKTTGEITKTNCYEKLLKFVCRLLFYQSYYTLFLFQCIIDPTVVFVQLTVLYRQ